MNQHSTKLKRETMTRYLAILALSSIIFIGPNSEAFLLNTSSFDMDYPGYHCTSMQKQREISIVHNPHPIYAIACDVTFKKDQQAPLPLWTDQRNTSTCEEKALAIAERLEDRGWQCKVAGIAD